MCVIFPIFAEMNANKQQIILAPLHGFTDYLFRNVYSQHFTGIDLAISPFISLTEGDKININRIRDLYPTNNKLLKVIPQLLGNDPLQFINMSDRLYEFGYEEVNWNLGCPIKKIAHKKRGSGMLPYPELLDQLLNEIIPLLKNKLSVKIRLGYYDTDEVYKVIEVLNKYPLNNICIHPRLGIQMYEGGLHLEVFKDIITKTNLKIIYNGDINTLSDFSFIKQNYPSLKMFMIGRGLLHNPFLAEIIKGNYYLNNEEASAKFKVFIYDLKDEILNHKKETRTLNKMKDYWQYFSLRFKNSAEVYDNIIHTNTLAELNTVTDRAFINEPMKAWVS